MKRKPDEIGKCVRTSRSSRMGAGVGARAGEGMDGEILTTDGHGSFGGFGKGPAEDADGTKGGR